MEQAIMAIAAVVSGLETAFEKATDQQYSNAEELCQNAGIVIERQVWTLAFVASHLVLWRTAKQVYQSVQPRAAQKLQELAGRVQKLRDANADEAVVLPKLSDDDDKSNMADLPIEYTDEDATALLSFTDSSGGLPVASSLSYGSNSAAHLDDDFVALD